MLKRRGDRQQQQAAAIFFCLFVLKISQGEKKIKRGSCFSPSASTTERPVLRGYRNTQPKLWRLLRANALKTFSCTLSRELKKKWLPSSPSPSLSPLSFLLNSHGVKRKKAKTKPSIVPGQERGCFNPAPRSPIKRTQLKQQSGWGGSRGRKTHPRTHP